MHNAGVLNDVYYSMLSRRNIVNGRTSYTTPWGTRYNYGLKQHRGNTLLTGDGEEDEHYGRSLRCCGISELDFSNVNAEASHTLNQSVFDELIAKYIRSKIRWARDNRVFIVGLPLRKTTRGSSGYDFKFYQRLLKTLESFGWKRITMNYTNKNSNNELAVLAVQKEEPDASLQTM